MFQIADRITVLRDGRSVGHGARGRRSPPDKVIALMVGREVKNLYPRPPHRGAASGRARASTDWSVEDPLIPAGSSLQDVSFEVREGEVLGIGGLMGAGRTALVSSLFGAARSPRRAGRSRWTAAPRAAPFASPAEAIAAGHRARQRGPQALRRSCSRRPSPRTSPSPRCASFVQRAASTTARASAQARRAVPALRIRAPGARGRS